MNPQNLLGCKIYLLAFDLLANKRSIWEIKYSIIIINFFLLNNLNSSAFIFLYTYTNNNSIKLNEYFSFIGLVML